MRLIQDHTQILLEVYNTLPFPKFGTRLLLNSKQC